MGATGIAALPLPKELEGQADEFALADNQTARLSRWNPAKLKEALERLKARGTEAASLGFNERDLQAILEKWGRIDVLVFVASVQPQTPLLDMDE